MVERRIRFAVVVIAACVAFTVGCRGDGEESTPAPSLTATATASPSATQTATPTATVSLDAQREEVREAYLGHWEAYAQALLELDATLVERHTAGEELEAIRAEIQQLRQDGVAVRLDVQHDAEVVEVTEQRAVIIDEVVNNSFFVDPVTKQPEVGEGDGSLFRYVVYLERTGDQWVVVRIEEDRSD